MLPQKCLVIKLYYIFLALSTTFLIFLPVSPAFLSNIGEILLYVLTITFVRSIIKQTLKRRIHMKVSIKMGFWTNKINISPARAEEMPPL